MAGRARLLSADDLVSGMVRKQAKLKVFMQSPADVDAASASGVDKSAAT